MQMARRAVFDRLPLFLSFEQVQDQPFPKKHAMLFSMLDLWHIPEFNYGVGADGTSQHALLRAFIIQSLEELKTVSALITFLEANEALKHLCGFCDGVLPDNSQFYRFLKRTKIFRFRRPPGARQPNLDARRGARFGGDRGRFQADPGADQGEQPEKPPPQSAQQSQEAQAQSPSHAGLLLLCSPHRSRHQEDKVHFLPGLSLPRHCRREFRSGIGRGHLSQQHDR